MAPRSSPHRIRLRRTAALLIGCVLASGCRTTTTEQPVGSVGVVQVAAPREAFEVVDGQGSRVGILIRFEGPLASRSHYMVRNVWQQDVGLIDHLGRAYRYVPHQPEPLWVGTGTVLEGAEEILGVHGCLLFELPFGPGPPRGIPDPPPLEAPERSATDALAGSSDSIGNS